MVRAKGFGPALLWGIGLGKEDCSSRGCRGLRVMDLGLR